jgi:hypothetical protein
VESSCKLGNEPSGSVKCWELPNGCTTCGLSSGTQLHRVNYLVVVEQNPLLLRPLIHLLYQPWMINGDYCGAILRISDWQGKPKYSEET